MQVNKIKGNCSMISISDNPNTMITKSQFLRSLNSAIVEHNSNTTSSISYEGTKAIMMVTNAKFSVRLLYYMWGFRKIGSYKGNYKKRAHILIYRCRKGL